MHRITPSWLTVTVWPATVTVPLRFPMRLIAMDRVTVPLPLSLAPVVTVIQLTLLSVVQVQAPGCGDVTLLVAPSAGTLLNVAGLT